MIKICGMREAENIRQVERLGIDWLGMIFWPQSKRYVAERPDYLPTRAKRVGVFVDTTIDDIVAHVNGFELDLIQLHGHESPDFISGLRNATDRPFIKAFNIASTQDLIQTRDYEGIVDYFLFDTKGKSVGGNGEKFDWSVLTDYHGETPFLLSGGIGPDDASRVKSFHHPRCIGIDLNSRFEEAPALKDINALKQFIDHLNRL
jgi:phosphoribosylanthranilate isomerase